MAELGNGLFDAAHHEEALSVKETELSMRRRLGGSECNILIVQSNIASTYSALGRVEEALRMRREVYSGRLKLMGEEHPKTLNAANNYAVSLTALERFEEARSLIRKMTPVARRVLGESHDLTLKMRMNYAHALYNDDDPTLDDIREAVGTLEEIERTARRVLGGAHPLTEGIGDFLRHARKELRAREAG